MLATSHKYIVSLFPIDHTDFSLHEIVGFDEILDNFSTFLVLRL